MNREYYGVNPIAQEYIRNDLLAHLRRMKKEEKVDQPREDYIKALEDVESMLRSLRLW